MKEGAPVNCHFEIYDTGSEEDAPYESDAGSRSTVEVGDES
jgi:hypothetical protein